MAGKFILKKFYDINLKDDIFESLKRDYDGFAGWFNKKAIDGRTALVYEDSIGIGAFVALKDDEDEEIVLIDSVLPAKKRTKIATFKISERYQGNRIGEGAVGLALWNWQRRKTEEIYFTAFDKQDILLGLFEKFGFISKGMKSNGEYVYIKSRSHIDFSNPYKAFPFINSSFKKMEYVIINDEFHDKIFAYSELKTNQKDMQNKIGNSVMNGLTKVYIGKAPDNKYEVGDPLLIYRRHQGSGAQHRSCVTSYGVVTDSFQAKRKGKILMTLDDLLKKMGNKTIFTESQIREFYNQSDDVTIIEMLYYGFFGAGNNVTQKWLNDNGCWPRGYPAGVPMKPEVFIKVLKEGKADVQNVIIDQS